MSFEPLIIIRKSDLEKNRDKIEMAEYDAIPKLKLKKRDEEDLIEAYSHLQRALDSSGVSFREIDLVIIHVEFTSKNDNVRSLLTELEIDFRIDI